MIELPTVELALLLVDSVLLTATFILLALSFREVRGRHELLRLLGAAVVTLTRREYFSAVLDALRDARGEVLAAVTGTPPRDEEEGDFLTEVEERVREASSRGVSVRYLIPMSPSHLHVGSRFSRAGAEVRYHPGLLVYDLRYMVVDEGTCVIGVPRARGQEEPTKKGFVISSPTLANLLKDHFSKYWGEATPYREYAERLVRELAEASPGAPPESLAGQLMVDPEEVRRILGAQPESGPSTISSDREREASA
ncbi:MAG: hypothetical protein DRO06_04220 [Thermoproteota archaeon]|nr:MAG: hypothetical protein DRO06_04220 [Candidatus Korarchaeota archaeon]